MEYSYRKSIGILRHICFKIISQLEGVNWFLRSHVIPEFIEINGHKLFLDKLDSLGIFRHGFYDQFQTEIVKKIIKKGDIVLDVGAHIGYFTLIFAKLVGKNGKVFAFEPDPTNFDLLTKNVEINGYKNVILVRKAFSDKTGKTNLFLSNINAGDHMIIDTKENRNSVEIEVAPPEGWTTSIQKNSVPVSINYPWCCATISPRNRFNCMMSCEPIWKNAMGPDCRNSMNSCLMPTISGSNRKKRQKSHICADIWPIILSKPNDGKS